MNIYESEISDGLVETLQSEAKISYASIAKPLDKKQKETVAALVKKEEFSTDAGVDDEDLYFLKSILVSTGWNKNDDVFLPGQVWAARKTPEHKYLDIEHDSDDIVGHIIENYAINEDGSVIEEESDSFHIVTGAVLYKHFANNAEKTSRSFELIDEIENGEWCVSMECLFAGFDYALTGPNNDQYVVERKEETAFLTKYLRAYGGEGQYEGYKVGRILKNITFSGKGLVKNPANPNSVIFAGMTDFNGQPTPEVDLFDKQDIILTSNNKEIQVDNKHLETINALEKQVADLTQERDEASQKLAQADIDALNESISELSKKVEARDGEITELTTKIEGLETVAKTSDDSLATAKTETEKVQEELDKIVAEATKASRIAKLAELSEDTEATYKKLAGLDDDAFDEMVALLKANKATEASDDDDNGDDDDSKDSSDSSADNADLDDVDDDDNDSAAASVGSGDDTTEMFEAVASYIGETTLKHCTTPEDK